MITFFGSRAAKSFASCIGRLGTALRETTDIGMPRPKQKSYISFAAAGSQLLLTAVSGSHWSAPLFCSPPITHRWRTFAWISSGSSRISSARSVIAEIIRNVSDAGAASRTSRRSSSEPSCSSSGRTVAAVGSAYSCGFGSYALPALRAEVVCQRRLRRRVQRQQQAIFWRRAQFWSAPADADRNVLAL